MIDQWKGCNQPAPKKHDRLAHDLAMWLASPAQHSLGSLTWENFEMPSPTPGDWGSCRPDVFAIKATLNPKKWNPITYEVKTSVADFQSDIRSGKWKKYQPFSAYIVFAIPMHLTGKIELPPGCGLIVRYSNYWSREVRGKRNKDWTLTDRQWMNLCLKARNPSPWEFKYTTKSPVDNSETADG